MPDIIENRIVTYEPNSIIGHINYEATGVNVVHSRITNVENKTEKNLINLKKRMNRMIWVRAGKYRKK